MLALVLSSRRVRRLGSTSSGSGSTVKLAGSKLGQILVDAKGRTLYLFEADKNGKSACTAPAPLRGRR